MFPHFKHFIDGGEHLAQKFAWYTKNGLISVIIEFGMYYLVACLKIWSALFNVFIRVRDSEKNAKKSSERVFTALLFIDEPTHDDLSRSLGTPRGPSQSDRTFN